MEESYTEDDIVAMLAQLMPELYSVVIEPRRTAQEPSSGNKPKSRPPLDLGALDLYHDCQFEIDCHKIMVEHICKVGDLYLQVKRHLGYAQMVTLHATVCHVCGCQLMVAEDASTDVVCVNEDCGNQYKQEDWIEILNARADAA